MVHNPSSDITGCLQGDGESNASNERLTAEIQLQAYSSLERVRFAFATNHLHGTELPKTVCLPVTRMGAANGDT